MFTWKAVVLAMAIMGLPLLVRTARAGFEQVNARYESVAATLGASPVRVFLTISLPLAWPSVLAGAVLAFARALGEFGATIIVAGSIPGATRTLAVAIYALRGDGPGRQALRWSRLGGDRVRALWSPNRLVERRAGVIATRHRARAGLVRRSRSTAQLDARAAALFGPSGAGKTTILEAIAGLRRRGAARSSSTAACSTRPRRHQPAAAAAPRRLRPAGRRALSPHDVRGNVLYGRIPAVSPISIAWSAMLEIDALLDRR